MTLDELRLLPVRTKEKIVYGRTSLRGRRLEDAYERVAKQSAEHRIDLRKFLGHEDFADSVLRSTPHVQTCPTVCLSIDPECSKLKPRLEFFAPDNIRFKRKDKIVAVFSATGKGACDASLSLSGTSKSNQSGEREQKTLR